MDRIISIAIEANHKLGSENFEKAKVCYEKIEAVINGRENLPKDTLLIKAREAQSYLNLARQFGGADQERVELEDKIKNLISQLNDKEK